MPSGEADGGSRTERVRFAAGTTGTEYADTLSPGGSTSYILGASRGQVLFVQVEHRNGPRTEFQIFRPDGSVLEPMRNTDRPFRDRLSASGDYIVEIVFATREPKVFGIDIEDLIQYGASPRASIYLNQAAKAYAFLQRRGYVIPQDIKSIGLDVLRHRVLLSYEAEAEDLTADDIINKIFENIEVP